MVGLPFTGSALIQKKTYKETNKRTKQKIKTMQYITLKEK
jgi:hypothetical protein